MVFFSATHYVPLMIQPDEMCTIPRIRPHKIPKIYPLVACPDPLTSYYCFQRPSDSGVSGLPQPKDHWTSSAPRRWKVIRVSRSERLSSDPDGANIYPSSRKLGEIVRVVDVDLKSIRPLRDDSNEQRPTVRLFALGAPTAFLGNQTLSLLSPCEVLPKIVFQEPRPTRRKLSRSPQKKPSPCDCVRPMAQIPEHEEVCYSVKPKQVRFSNTPSICRNK
ncbi:unnamed protein product [Heligmosomoides polygyrus]|uniref:Uncharacterized protein n=1 Tax=Heligmosomoides polygyrus TaxID=6339 RepID=A0A183GAR8_HELPZ|nr:unnamed protein product [Heligmosomoides polygyrus]